MLVVSVCMRVVRTTRSRRVPLSESECRWRTIVTWQAMQHARTPEQLARTVRLMLTCTALRRHLGGHNGTHPKEHKEQTSDELGKRTSDLPTDRETRMRRQLYRVVCGVSGRVLDACKDANRQHAYDVARGHDMYRAEHGGAARSSTFMRAARRGVLKRGRHQKEDPNTRCSERVLKCRHCRQARTSLSLSAG